MLEEDVADENDPLNFPDDFNNKIRFPKDSGEPCPYHFAISGKNARKFCKGSTDASVVKRNVIIGDMIQTDYSEIRIRHKGSKKWLYSRDQDMNLLFTLGIVFSQTLVDILGKERGAVDFTIMPNGHICIFDTNPGGAGYANQLSNIQIMKDVIGASKQLLTDARNKDSKDMLLDKNTLRFLKYVDIDKALDWIREEEEASNVLPVEIKSIFPKATETTLSNLLKAVKESYRSITLFADNLFYGEKVDGWNYDDEENGWKAHYLLHFLSHSSQTSFCLTESTDSQITEPVLTMIRKVEAWTGKGVWHLSNPFKEKGLYPLAYIEGLLYFTNNREYTALNNKWGGGTMYMVRTENPANEAMRLDISYHVNTKLIILAGDAYNKIHTNELGEILCKESGGIIDNFIKNCKKTGLPLQISYQDEHLKSILGMVFTLQTIGYFTKAIGNDFKLNFLVETYTDNGFKNKFNANLPTSHDRDEWLTKLTKKWLIDTNNLANGAYKGTLCPVISLNHGKLPHWRVLTIKCGDRTLNIYPDGGFMNGWNFKPEHKVGVHYKYYEIGTTTTDDIIPLERVQDIKFDIEVE